jgi:predicted regulator of Ras-like GTPase activity (Roadblock/LC7/MglB family)
VLSALHAEDLARFATLLDGFLAETRARCALLVDRTGRLLTMAGETSELDGTTFASLAAADFGASDQLASLLGEREFASLYHHGESSSMYLTDLGGHAILAAIFDGRSTLGLVRLKLKPLVPALIAVFEDLANRAPDPRLPELDESWGTEAENEIDRLFSEG